MTRLKPPRAVGVYAVPEQPEPAHDDPPTLDLTLPPPAGIPWLTARNWAIAGAVGLVTCLLVVGLVVFTRDSAGTVTAPLDDRRRAELYLATGTGAVTVRGQDLGGDLYRASTPGGGPAPEVADQDGRVELLPAGEPGAGAVEIALNTRVRWQITLSGGAVEQVVDMREGGLAGIDVTAGADRVELSLPYPDGTTAVRVGAGAGELALSAPVGVPVQARLASGAGHAVVDGVGHTGIAAGTVITSGGWHQAEDRYRVDAGGLGRLVLERR